MAAKTKVVSGSGSNMGRFGSPSAAGGKKVGTMKKTGKK